MTIRIVVATHTPENTRRWCKHFEQACPQANIVAWDEGQTFPPADYAVVWRPPVTFFRRQQGLKAVFNLGAGVDSLMALSDLPSDLPIVRLEDAGMADQMVEYVLHGIAHVTRDFVDYEASQQAGRWAPLPGIRRHDWPVGVMGLGKIGIQIAQAISTLGYPVAGWSRSARSIADIETYDGVSGLSGFLSRTRLLVNVLPLTGQTADILDRENLQKLKAGGYVINIARGQHLVDQDLVELIDSGHLQGALLDVFRTEPLPADHPFWTHPKIRITPHIAGATLEQETIDQITKKICLLENGQSITGVVSRELGY